MDAATKSRTSEDILRSSRLSAYSPEPCSQSESDYCPYTSSPRGTNAPSPQSHHELRCSRSVQQRSAPFFFVTLRLSLSVRPRSLSPPGVCAKESLSSALALSAYRMPRRRYSTGGDEESWSNSLQRVSGFVISLTGIIVIITIVI